VDALEEAPEIFEFLLLDILSHARAVAAQILLTLVHVLNASWSHWCAGSLSLCARFKRLQMCPINASACVKCHDARYVQV